VQEAIDSDFEIHSVYSTDCSKFIPILLGQNSKFEISGISEKELEHISGLKTPNETLAVVRQKKQELPDFSTLKNRLTLVLDGISDPGNLGTIIRTADWFGIENIICSENSVDLYNPKVVQATMGSVFRVSVHYVNLVDWLKTNSVSKTASVYVYACTLKGKSIYEQAITKKGLVILGSESHGISKDVLTLADYQISIPSFGKAESLNIAVAAGVVCGEFKRS